MRRTDLALTLCLVAAPAFATCKSDAADKTPEKSGHEIPVSAPTRRRAPSAPRA